MLGRELLRTAAAEPSLGADPQALLDAIIANAQSNVFLVDIGDGSSFCYVPLGGPALIAAYTRKPHRHAMASPGLTPFDLFGAEGGAKVVARYRECLAAGRPIVYEERLAMPGGDRWWQTSLTPIRDRAGAVIQLLGIAIDITDRKVAEAQVVVAREQAAAASHRLLGAIERFGEAIAIFDADDALVLCNASYREVNGPLAAFMVPGVRFEALLRHGLDCGLFPDAAGVEAEWLESRMASHRRANSRIVRRTTEGRWLQIVEQRTPDGGTVILGTDITEVKRRQTALAMLAAAGRDGVDFFRDAVRSLAAGLGYRWAGIGQLFDGGRTMATLAFCSDDEVAGGGLAATAGTPCGSIIECGGFLAVEHDAALRYPAAVQLSELGAVSFVGDLVFDGDGRAIAVVFGFDDKPDPLCGERSDITGLIAARVSLELQRRDTERQLREAKEAAEVASRAKSEFLANMSHELRTPLNAVIGFSQMIGEEILGPVGRAEYKEYACDIHTSSLHLLQIINDILDVSKIEAGMLTLHGAAVDFATVVESCARLVRTKALTSEITLAIELAEALPTIWADERLLKQIVLNLLSNALKFTPAGGRVTLAASPGSDGGLVFSVRDTGIGIAAEDFAKVFQPFGQVDSSLTRRFEGTGLGLPLTKGLIELHGGTIALESEIGHGTVVTVRLPQLGCSQLDTAGMPGNASA
jgi:signal transduction histidine kinase